MSDKLNEQTDKMGEMAQATLDKTKDAVSKYMAESQRIFECCLCLVERALRPGRHLSADCSVVSGRGGSK